MNEEKRERVSFENKSNEILDFVRTCTLYTYITNYNVDIFSYFFFSSAARAYSIEMINNNTIFSIRYHIDFPLFGL